MRCCIGLFNHQRGMLDSSHPNVLSSPLQKLAGRPHPDMGSGAGPLRAWRSRKVDRSVSSTGHVLWLQRTHVALMKQSCQVSESMLRAWIGELMMTSSRCRPTTPASFMRTKKSRCHKEVMERNQNNKSDQVRGVLGGARAVANASHRTGVGSLTHAMRTITVGEIGQRGAGGVVCILMQRCST